MKGGRFKRVLLFPEGMTRAEGVLKYRARCSKRFVRDFRRFTVGMREAARRLPLQALAQVIGNVLRQAKKSSQELSS